MPLPQTSRPSLAPSPIDVLAGPENIPWAFSLSKRRLAPGKCAANHSDVPTHLAQCNLRKECDTTEASAEPFHLNTTTEASEIPQSPAANSALRMSPQRSGNWAASAFTPS